MDTNERLMEMVQQAQEHDMRLIEKLRAYAKDQFILPIEVWDKFEDILNGFITDRL